jgi:forkhead box protein D
MFDNGSFLRRRKRYKRTSMNQGVNFPAVFSPFAPFWIRKPVPVIPVQFPHSNIPNFNDNLSMPRNDFMFDNKLGIFGKGGELDNEFLQTNVDSLKISMNNIVSASSKMFQYSNNSEVYDESVNSLQCNNNNNDNSRISNSYTSAMLGGKLSSSSGCLPARHMSNFNANYDMDTSNDDDKINVESDEEYKSSEHPFLQKAVASEKLAKVDCDDNYYEDDENSDRNSVGSDRKEEIEKLLPETIEKYNQMKAKEAFDVASNYKETKLLDFDFARKKKHGNTKGFSIENLIGCNIEER